MSPVRMDWTLRGAGELDRKLAALPPAIAKRLLTRDLREAATVIRDEARRRAPVEAAPGGQMKSPGLLRRSIVARVRTRGSAVVASIGVRSRAWYGRLVELGTTPHVETATRYTRFGRKTGRGARVLASSSGAVFGRTVHHPGAKAAPFLEPAMEAKADEAITILIAALRGELESVASGGGA